MQKLQTEYLQGPLAIEIAPGQFIAPEIYSQHLRNKLKDPQLAIRTCTDGNPPRDFYQILIKNSIANYLSLIQDPRLANIEQLSPSVCRISVEAKDMGFLNCLFNNIARPEVQELGEHVFELRRQCKIPEIKDSIVNLYGALVRVNAFNSSHEAVTRFFTQELIKTDKEGWTSLGIEQSAINLDRILWGKPPLSPLIKSLICGVIGAFVGAVIGIAVGATATAWGGSFGALPGAIIGAAKGFSLGVKIGLSAGAASSGITCGLYGFFSARQAKTQYDARKLELGKDVSDALGQIFSIPSKIVANV